MDSFPNKKWKVNMHYKRLENLKIVLSGQLITSRTETLEEYLRERIDTLAVIGITSPFAPKNVSRCSLYKKGELIKEFKLPSFQIPNMRWYKQPLLSVSFLIYFISIFYSVIRLRKKFDFFIGISCLSAFAGTLLKRLNIVKSLIYYSIDYFLYPVKFSFTTLVIGASRIADKLCVKNADLTWHISPRIPEARYKFAKVPPDSYTHLVAPLTYASKFLRSKPVKDIERYTIGFVGTITENQGLQLLIEAMPKIIKVIPQVKVRIIGKGPYGDELKRMVKKSSLDNYFIFHGFIKDDEEVLDILSGCAIGVAIWSSREDDNIAYADPGKPKLYAFCGLPIIITNGTLVAKEIDDKKAGISINYTENELIEAMIKLLKEEDILKAYKNNASEFAKRYVTDKIFDSIFQKTVESFNTR